MKYEISLHRKLLFVVQQLWKKAITNQQNLLLITEILRIH